MADLPFQLTDDQQKAISEILNDMRSPYPLNRLLQGDVGSGKTIVAIAASIFSTGRGEQVAVMAPTEVLANQHHSTFSRLLPPGINLSLLTGSMSKKEKAAIYGRISSGEIDIIIGTHALIQEDVNFKNLGLIIIDEQHRFGVNQRARLRAKGASPDLLVMTATPIPRSLSLTLYGDLDTSYIRQKPLDRQPIITLSFPESRLKGVYNSIEKYMEQGRQVYYVLPLIEESENLDLKSAIETHDFLKKNIFPQRRVELLHGRMPKDDKERIMRDFTTGQIHLLVTTTVVEVGIDVANASIMVIEHAERFGLSQLHQLRGRVGRGRHQSFCILVYPENISYDSKRRIETITNTDDGFKIAEEDLRFRGAGEIIGLRQHGHSSGFEFAELENDIELILTARKEAEATISIDNIDQIMLRLKQGNDGSSLLKGIRTRRILALLS